MTIGLTTMAAASLAILVYIAIVITVITGTNTTQNIPSISTNTSLAEQAKLDSAMSQQDKGE
jgi:hypothetical protein